MHYDLKVRAWKGCRFFLMQTVPITVSEVYASKKSNSSETIASNLTPKNEALSLKNTSKLIFFPSITPSRLV